MRSPRKIRSFACVSALLLLCGAQAAHADSVGQVQTTKYFAPETVALIKQRVQDVANGVPGATLGFRQGDTISYIIQFTPIANSSNVGAGGYITDYIPAGTQVTGAWFVQPDGGGGFYQTAPPKPAQMANGFGVGGLGAFNASWTSDAYTIATCTAAYPASATPLATCTGNLAQLYADTGIFYSTDPRTAVFVEPSIDGRTAQWSAPTGNGYNVCPARGSQLVPLMGGVVTACGGGSAAKVSTHNVWDASMTNAFGTTAGSITALAAMAPSAGNAAVDTNGAGLPPFNAGSPVAGPDAGYQLDYTGNVGPWQRISYPGSMVGSNAFAATANPATVAGANTVLATPTFSGASFPLPASTNAVRWAAGRLTVGMQSYVKISLLLTSPPPAIGLVNNSEVFGGDASPESTTAMTGNRDNAWVYHVPSVASNVSTLYILKEVVCVYDATGTCVPNNGANLPAAGTPATVGPKVRYRISYINTNNGTQHNVTICDQLPKTATAINFATAVSPITANPNIGAPASPAAAACGFGAGGTTFSYPVIPVIAGGGAGIIEYDVQLPLLTVNTTIVNAARAVSTEIPSGVTSYAPSNVVTSAAANLLISKSVYPSTPAKGDTVTYTVTVTNTGSTAANVTTLVDTLPGVATAVVANQVPSRFNYVATGAATVNGAPLSGVTAVVTPPLTPATINNETVTWTFQAGTTVPAGGQLALTFTATAGANAATNLMVYNPGTGTTGKYSNTATINCSAACVVAPVLPNTTTSRTTGATATVTLTAPALQLSKTIDCVFDLGVCTPGSYTSGGAIPTSAMLRYKIVYTNPQAYAQTVTLSDTLPATAMAAGDLYVESGPDIRPSAPVLSVNPAAAGAPRGLDAALTPIAASSVVNFTAVALPGGSSGTLYMDVQNNATAGAVTNTASINSVERTAAGGAAVTSAATATAAALLITKTASASSIGSGGMVNYTITVTNTGAAAVSVTRITDTLPTPAPAGSTIQCGTSAATCLATATLNGAPFVMPAVRWATSSLQWRNPALSIPAGGVFVLTFPVTFGPTVAPGTYLNRTVQVRAAATTTLTNSAPVTVLPNTISVNKSVVSPASASIAPNSPVTYAITVTNTGPGAVPVTSVVDTLPAAPAGTGTIAYTSTTSVLVNGVAQTGVASPTLPVGAQYQSPAPVAAVAGTQQAVTWTFPAAGSTVINPGQAMVVTFVAQFGAIPTGATYLNDVRVNYTGGSTASEFAPNLAPVSVPALSRITKTIDCVYQPACVPGSYVDGAPIPVNAKLGYKIVYENLSAAAASGITITDTLPTQVGANAISNMLVNGVVTAAPANAAGGGTVTLLTAGALAVAGSGSITFDLQTTAAAGAGVTNLAMMVSAQDPMGVSSSTTAQAAGGNLTLSKAVTSGTPSTVAQGGTVSYTITVNNSGSADAMLNNIVDTLPGVANAAGATWRFAYAATGAITLNGAAIAPAYTTAVTTPAAPATLNREMVDWTFTGGIVIPAGQTLALTFTATVGTLMPKGAAAPGATYYNDVTANYTGGAFTSALANSQAPVLVPFYTLTMNKTIDCVYDASAACQPYTGAPIPPNAKVRYKLLYSNLSALGQTVTVKDTLPTQVAANAISNMTVDGLAVAAPANAAGGGTVVLQNAVVLAGGASATISMDVQTNALAGVTVNNCASISAVAADTCATVGVVKSTATASVQDVAVLSIAKTSSTPNVIAGGAATYTITIANTGTAATTSLKVYDFLPYSGSAVDASKRLAYAATTGYTLAGVATALTPAITTAVAPTVPPYASNMNQQQVLWDFGNYALPPGATLTITFNAAVGAAMPGVSYYNSVRHEYTSAGISFNANVDNAALITVGNAQPSLTLLKTVAVLSDPLNGATDPKFIPGALASYTLVATNSGTGSVDNDSLVITDPLPSNTALFVNDIGAAGSGPLLFSQGATSSTLTYTFTALDDVADDVAFSNDNAATWTYVPAPGADGCDPQVTHLRINPKGAFVGNPAAPSPSFNVNFRACVK